MQAISSIKAALAASALILAVSTPAQAYWGSYYGYAPRPYYPGPPAYYVPYYQPRVLYVPPPAYIPPPAYAVRPVYAVPRPPRRARHPAHAARGPAASPFSGPGILPAAAPTVTQNAPGPAIAPMTTPIPKPPAPPANNVYPPEREFTPFGD